jgi:ABC-2 type transport system permease protein
MTVHVMPRALVLRTFLAMFARDAFVTTRELGSFVAQVVIQPLLMLFIFGTVLTGIGYVADDYVQVLLPGIVALTGFLGALQNTTMPLVVDFSWTREIEDRLMAPIPLSLVAMEKMLFGAARGVVAAILVIPIGFVVLDSPLWPVSAYPGVIGMVLLGALAGSAIGMAIGTLVTPGRIQIVFAMTLTPLTFTGATQFPWRELAGMPWFQVVCAINPLTYVSEGMRAILGQGTVPAIPLWLDVSATLLAITLFGAIGIHGFRRRATS